MITLYQLPRSWGVPNLSQFCAKVATYLRLAEIPYQVATTLPIKAPRGKLPYIEDQGRKIIVSDSRLIIRYLKANYGDPLDARLSAEEKGIATAWRRLIEEHLYWASMHTRWNYGEPNWQANKREIFSILPPLIRDVIALGYRYRIKSQLLGQGMGRLTAEEIFDLGREDLDALAAFLGEKPYFLGAEPTSLDATAYGFLVNIVGTPIESPLKDHARGHANLVEYCRRIQTRCFPEFPPDY
jgi:glutathione S-transferase